MLTPRRALFIGFLSAVAVASAACGKEAISCDRASECSGDPTPPWGAAATCQSNAAGACGTQWQAYVACAQNNQTCSGGFTDEGVLNAQCQAYRLAFEQCCGDTLEGGTKCSP